MVSLAAVFFNMAADGWYIQKASVVISYDISQDDGEMQRPNKSSTVGSAESLDDTFTRGVAIVVLHGISISYLL